MKRAHRQRNKKKFGATSPLEKPKNATVKVKPKEEEPCSTKNRKPRKVSARQPSPTETPAASA
jgi:hypothetical protein